ncbi:hypothetical protein D3C81_2292740 [compost metagenome]
MEALPRAKALDKAKAPDTVNTAAARPKSQVSSGAAKDRRMNTGKATNSRLMMVKPSA